LILAESIFDSSTELLISSCHLKREVDHVQTNRSILPDVPLFSGQAAKAVIIQFARGDKTNPNPTTTALIRAGDLADRATLFRNDLAFALNPAFPKNPHTFLTNLASAPAVAAVAVGAQSQIAVFFASNGALTIDPDGPGPLLKSR
jgi:hypothetical protein